MRHIDLDKDYVERHKNLMNGMCEKQKRLYLGNLAIDLKYGGISAVATHFGVGRNRVSQGVKEVRNGEVYVKGDRNRAPGAGRPSIIVTHQKEMQKANLDEELGDILKVVDDVVRKATYGDSMTTRKWINGTVKSVAIEVEELTGKRYSHASIKRLIRRNGYSLQQNQKFEQVGEKHPLRDVQFRHIQEQQSEFLKAGDPVISIDTKAKEKIGDFIRSGREYRKIHDPRRVLDHDFAFTLRQVEKDNPLIPKALLDHKAIVIPYGVYCVNNNEGFVTLGIDSDTSEFAVNAIFSWWNTKGKKQFPHSKRILILTDGGGSNRSKGWLFKIALQQFADNTGLEVNVCHFAPGKSKWNPIEHMLWSQVSHTWGAKPLTSLEVIKEYVENTTTLTGLKVSCIIDYRIYMNEKEKAKARSENKPILGIDNSPEIQSMVLIERWGEEETDLRKWNYIIRPHISSEKWHNYGVVMPNAS